MHWVHKSRKDCSLFRSEFQEFLSKEFLWKIMSLATAPACATPVTDTTCLFSAALEVANDKHLITSVWHPEQGACLELIINYFAFVLFYSSVMTLH